MINLLPYIEKKDIKRIRVMRMLTVALMSVIALALILCALLAPTILTINSRYTLWQGEVIRLEQAGAAVSAESMADSETRVERLKKEFIAPSTLSPIDAITIAQNAASKGITFSGFAFVAGTEQTLSIQGVVTTRDVLQRYVTALTQQSSVVTVDSPVTNYLKQRDNEFTLTVVFK